MADELVTPEQARQQLRVDEGVDEALIDGLVVAATRLVEVCTGRTVADGDDAFGPDASIAGQAVLMLVRSWYDNPDPVLIAAAPVELPPAVAVLLWPLKRLKV